MKLHGTMRVNANGHLEIGGCDVVQLAKKYGTPLYIMDEAQIREICQRFYAAFVEKYGNAQVIYASKAFLTIAMCRIIESEGLGLDVVSGGELYTALQARFPVQQIYFHGNNKSPSEIAMALEARVGRIVVDNFYELDMVNKMARTMGIKAHILLRVTPGIEAHTHEYIKTGQIDSKFGFTLPNGQAMEALKSALTKENLIVEGVHCHIGSQVFEMESYQHAAAVMMDFINDIYQETGVVMAELNLGGGFGIYYNSEDTPAEIDAYADKVMSEVLAKAEEYGFAAPKVIVEPGRAIAGPAGTTAYTVGSIKEIPGVRKYVAVDGGMTDNIRPALYQARYEVGIANKADQPPQEVVSVTGKCCESGDMLAWDVKLPLVESGDILVMPCTGAYGYTMSSNYNRLGRPAVVLVYEGQADLIVARESYEDLLRNDLMPERLKPGRVVSLASYR